MTKGEVTYRSFQTHGDATIEELVRTIGHSKQAQARLRKAEKSAYHTQLQYPFIIDISGQWFFVNKTRLRNNEHTFDVIKCSMMKSKSVVDMEKAQHDGTQEQVAWIRYSEQTITQLMNLIAQIHEHNQRDEFGPLGRVIEKMSGLARGYLVHLEGGSLPSNNATEGKGDDDGQ